MPADYDKLFRSAEDRESADAAPAECDANPSYPSPLTLTHPPKSNGETPSLLKDAPTPLTPPPAQPPPPPMPIEARAADLSTAAFEPTPSSPSLDTPPPTPANWPPLPSQEPSGSVPPIAAPSDPRPPAQHSRRARRGRQHLPDHGELDSAINELKATADLILALPSSAGGPDLVPQPEPNVLPIPVEPPGAATTPTTVDEHIPAPPSDTDPTPKPSKPKPAKQVSQRGWRRWVHTFTRINFGLSPDEKYELDLLTRIRRNPRGSYQIGVLAMKGGVGKTTVTATLGLALAQVRNDRTLALDADADYGNLADRLGCSSTATITDLLADQHLSHYNDVRAHISVDTTNLEILPAEKRATTRRRLSGEDLRFAADTVSKFYNVVLVDCGAGVFDPAARGVLETVSAVVIVTSVSVDSAQQAENAINWLHHNGYQDLLSRACVVVNQVALGETNIATKQLVQQFQQKVQPGRVVLLPWDKHIAAGTEIQPDLLDPSYKRRVLELAAVLSDDFERAGRR